MKRDLNCTKTHNPAFVMKVTCSWIVKRVRDREKYNGARDDNGPTAVVILPDLDAEVDILVRSAYNLEPELLPHLLGVYKNPTPDMIMEDLEAFYA